MDQDAQDAKLGRSKAFDKDESWRLAAAEACSKSVRNRGGTAAKQLKLVDAPIRKNSPPAAAGHAVGEAEASAMMAAMRNQAVLAPGKVLLLEGTAFLPHRHLRGVYIRDCYKKLAAVLLTTPNTSFILTGTPGTGTSVFFYAFVQQLLQLPNPPPFIIWQHAHYHGSRGFCYNTRTGETLSGQVHRFGAELNNPDTWYIADAVPPELSGAARLLLITSPDSRETYQVRDGACARRPASGSCCVRAQEVAKLNALMLYMPLWSLEELLACRSKLGLPVPEAFVKKCFEYGGGVARYSLLHKGVASEGVMSADAIFGRLLKGLRGAVNSGSVSQVRAALADAGALDDRLIHITTDCSFCEWQPVFASRWVAEVFTAQALAEDELGLERLMNGTTGTIRGQLHEARMHLILPKGGEFAGVAVEFADGMAKLERGTEEMLKVPACSEVVLFKELAKVAVEHCEEGVYFKPASTTFPLADSVLCAGGTVTLFQMTVGGSNPVDFAALEQLLRDLGLTPQQEVRLVFAVPEDVYPDFKLNVKMGNEGTRPAAGARGRPRKACPPAPAPVPPALAPARAPRPKLYIMRVPRTRLEVRALSAQGGRRGVRTRIGLRW